MSELKKQSKIRTGELTKKVLSFYSAGHWSSAKYTALTQVRAATGWADMNTADVMIMGNWPSSGCLLEGFEVKVSRADWLNEVKNPTKNDSVKKYCDKWWLVIADENMVKPGELPDSWGMMALDGRKLKIVKKAPLLKPEPMDNLFVASLLRHNDKEMIPIDVHNDTIKDVKREAEAQEKKKSAELYEHIKTLHKALGIKITANKELDYTQAGRKKVFTGWVSSIEKNYSAYNKSADSMAKIIARLPYFDDLVRDAEYMIKIAEDIKNRGEAIRDVERALVWAEYTINAAKKFLSKHKSDDS